MSKQAVFSLFIVICSVLVDNTFEAWPDTLCYPEALDKAILFFEAQRSGKLPAEQRIKWRGDSALTDGSSEKVDLTGGYYDAGDNVKFVWPMSYSATLLSWAAIEYHKEIASVNQQGYLHGAIRWATDFLLAAHPNPTTFYTQVGDANADHACWERPEDMDTPRTLYKITSSSPGSEPAAEAAAALASASIVFKREDPAYSDKLLKSAKSLFELADKYRGSYQASCPFYCSHSGYQDELLWGAAWLLRATGDQKYMSYVTSNQGWSQQVNEFSWDNKFAGVQALLAREAQNGRAELSKFKSDADSFVCAYMPQSSSKQVQITPGGLIFTRDSSNLQYATSATMVLLIHSRTLNKASIQCGSTSISGPQIYAFAKQQVDYILGKNPMKMSYMAGYGAKFPQQLHHRGASIPSITTNSGKIGCSAGQSYFNNNGQNAANPNVLTGGIAGGPDSSDKFNDQRNDYSHAEPTTYINAAFVGCVSAMIGPDGSKC